MQRKPSNIYEPQRKQDHLPADDTKDALDWNEAVIDSDAAPSKNDPYQQQIRANRRNNYLMALLFLVVLAGIFYVFSKQQPGKGLPLDPERAQLKTENDDTFSAYASLSKDHLAFNTNQDISYAYETLAENDLIELTDQASYPLDSTWIKQAGTRLNMADKALQHGQLNEALLRYNEALKIYPDIKDVQRYIGLIHLQKKEFDLAISAFEKAIAQESNNPRLLNNLGICFLGLNEYDKALIVLEAALIQDPSYLMAHYNIATLYYRQQAYDKSLPYFEYYLGADNENLEAYQLYAKSLIQLDEWDVASEVLAELSRKMPDSAPVYFRLAQALSMQQQPSPAMSALEQGIALMDTRRALSWLNKKEFDVLRSSPEFQTLVESLSKN